MMSDSSGIKIHSSVRDRRPAPGKRWFSGLSSLRAGIPAALVLALLPSVACKLPSSMRKSEPGAQVQMGVQGGASEAMAQQEYDQIHKAESQGSRVPRYRYEKLITDYPNTRVAYDANLYLAEEDYRGIGTVGKTTSSSAFVKDESQKFIDRYASGPLAHPPFPDIKQRYDDELQPMLYQATVNVNSWPTALTYLQAFPDGPYAPKIRDSIESAIRNPKASWQAIDVLTAYSEAFPEQPSLPALGAQVESNLYRRLKLGAAITECERFLTEFPGSVHAAPVRDLIVKQMIRQITPYSDPKELQDLIARDPSRPEADLARSMLDRLQLVRASFDRAVASRSISELEAFIAANPTSPLAGDAVKAIEDIKLQAIDSGTRSQLQSLRSQGMSGAASVGSDTQANESRLADLRKQYAANEDRIKEQRGMLERGRRQLRGLQQEVKDLQIQRDRLSSQRKPSPEVQARIAEFQEKIKAQNEKVANKTAEVDKLLSGLDSLETQNGSVQKEIEALELQSSSEADLRLMYQNQVQREFRIRLNKAYLAATGQTTG